MIISASARSPSAINIIASASASSVLCPGTLLVFSSSEVEFIVFASERRSRLLLFPWTGFFPSFFIFESVSCFCCWPPPPSSPVIVSVLRNRNSLDSWAAAPLLRPKDGWCSGQVIKSRHHKPFYRRVNEHCGSLSLIRVGWICSIRIWWPPLYWDDEMQSSQRKRDRENKFFKRQKWRNSKTTGFSFARGRPEFQAFFCSFEWKIRRS